ncbi:cytochrome P450 [Rhodococcus sp. PAMC28707]|uniref:cytochrome P450 n=1 Tax=unclassified Rhodococcus (in: high G+C Gram-positive bacteria) TaxID=192944 RepID=UPI00109E32A7|nr:MULTISPECIES: cytochrome P450 [unclassified Rhodococcus (in: high G+C Gram-positive bacteria)]QCB51795.1 cytochrome P450 [Rhodococcus sp. PAMC28705]QCB60037.1 cytochrome P450 [Rhodococcus sp. PAMC28707]
MTVTDSRALRARDRILPHPPHRIPILGDLWDLHVTDSSQWGMRGAQKYGPIYERKILGARVTYVSGPDLVAEVNDEATWAKFLGVPIRDLRSIAGDGLFTAHNSEENWAKAHAILAPAFTQSAMRTYHDAMTQSTRNLLRYWDDQRPGTWFDIPADMNKLALEIIGRVAFGYEFDSFAQTEPHDLVVRILRSMRYINRAAYSHPLVEATVFRSERDQHRDDVRTIHRLVDDIVAARRAGRSRGSEGDLLDLMLNKVDPESGEPLSDRNIRNQILTFLVAGQETSAGVLAFALHYLSINPDVADKVRGEVENVCSEGELTFEHVGKLRYLRRVVDETLRLWPVAPGYYRKARNDTTVGQHPFEGGEWVFVVLLQLHRDKAWGEDADEFNPDRWSRDRRPADLQNLYKPFGTGIRACIGRQFAYHEILVALALIVSKCKFEPKPEYELRVNETISLKPTGLTMSVIQSG